MSSILSSILGHGAPAAPPSHGLPPDLAAAIGSGSPAGADPAQEQNEVELLNQIIGDIHKFMQVAADEDDKATMATCLANIQKIKAKDQAETDGAVKGQMSPRLARKSGAAQGGPGGGY